MKNVKKPLCAWQILGPFELIHEQGEDMEGIFPKWSPLICRNLCTIKDE